MNMQFLMGQEKGKVSVLGIESLHKDCMATKVVNSTVTIQPYVL